MSARIVAVLAVCLALLAPSAAPAAAQTLPQPAPPTAHTAPQAYTAPQAQASPTEPPVYDPGPLTDGSAPPELPAEAWILVDLNTGDVLAAHEPELPHPPASTIKLLTGLALVEELDDPEAEQEAVFEDMAVDGTKVGIVQQNDYTIGDLFHAMLMSSANDAAHSLGEAVGGQERAVELMNAKAAELGLTGTLARDTAGLNDTEQHTTVTDLVRIGNAVLADDYLMEVIGTTEYDFPGAVNPDTDEENPGYPIANHTRVVGEVDGGLGLKNGFTRKAGGSFVAVVERDGTRLASAVLGAQTHTRDGAVDLIEWGFAQSSPAPVSRLDLRTPAEAEEEARAEEASAREAEEAAAQESPAAEEAAEARLPLTAPAWLGLLGIGGAVLVLVVLAALLRGLRGRSRAPRH